LSFKGYEGETVEATEKMLKEREKDLREFLDQASLRGIEVEYVLRKGKPGAEIIKFAEENNMDLIVIGTQGRSPLTDALVGSAARTVLHQATCPVLVVHPYDRFFVE
jgi:universal stress protein A